MYANNNRKRSNDGDGNKLQSIKDHHTSIGEPIFSSGNKHKKRIKNDGSSNLDESKFFITHTENSSSVLPILPVLLSNDNNSKLSCAQYQRNEIIHNKLDETSDEDDHVLDESLSGDIESGSQSKLMKLVRILEKPPSSDYSTTKLLPKVQLTINLLNLSLNITSVGDSSPGSNSGSTLPFQYNAIRIRELCLCPSQLQQEEDEDEAGVIWCDFCGFLDENEFQKKVNSCGGELSWLMQEIMACSNYQKCPHIVASGEFQAALHIQKHTQEHITTFAILTLLRLVLSYREEMPILEFLVSDIYDFLLDVLVTPAKFYHDFWKSGALNGQNRMYSNFMALSLAAHIRPIRILESSIPYNEQVQYEKITQSFLTQYHSCFSAVRKGKASGLPASLNERYRKLSTHNMASDIFIELNRHGLWEKYTGDDNYNSKCCRVMDKFTINLKKNDYRTVLLYYVMYMCPKVTTRIKESPDVLEYARVSICDFIRQSYSDDLGCSEGISNHREEDIKVSVHLASASARLLICVLLAAQSDNIASLFVIDLRNSQFSQKLFSYLTSAPYTSRLIDHPNYREFYELTWTLLSTVGFTFPLCMDELVRLSCSEHIPISLRGHAALEIASFIFISRNQLSEHILQRIYGTLREYAIISPTAELRNSRVKLAYLMKILIECGLENPSGNVEPGTPKGMLENVFNPVLYYQDLGSDYLEDDDSKEYRMCLALLKE